MKWINAEQQVTVNIYDDEHEEYLDKIMTVEEMLDAYTDEGCPTMYINPEPNKGKWIEYEVDIAPHPLHCSICGFSNHHISNRYMMEFRRCPNCGAEMSGGEESE